jgi:hypothetical protein
MNPIPLCFLYFLSTLLNAKSIIYLHLFTFIYFYFLHILRDYNALAGEPRQLSPLERLTQAGASKVAYAYDMKARDQPHLYVIL